MTASARLHLGDAAAVLPTLPPAHFDLVLTDPPYPCIKRSYGTWTEAEWWALMRAVVPECMRVLKPTGSAVFILQPNSERVGRMRTWHLEFQLWVAREWGIVQDAYWWNNSSLPHPVKGQLTPAVKACVWVGPEGCSRHPVRVVRKTSTPRQDAPAFSHARGEHSRKRMYAARERNGGSWPHNCIPMGNRAGGQCAGDIGHGAGTPLALCSWWTRYLCPPGGRVLDPFCGSGTVGLAALAHGAEFVGIERVPEYVEIARRRLAAGEAEHAMPLFADP